MSALNQLKRNISDLINDPQGYLRMVAENIGNSAAGRKAVINDRGAGMQNLSKEERRQQMQQAVLDNFGSGGMGALGIIKGKGGNWLTGSVENALSRLKSPEYLAPELVVRGQVIPGVTGPVAERGTAINKWIEGPLTKYVKRDMATEGDPVRKLAEQGVLHVSPEQLNINMTTYGKHPFVGQTFVGKHPSAQAWEGASDLKIQGGAAKDLPSRYRKGNQWLETVPPETQVHSIYEESELPGDLGFKHLTDELYNALNPESGLPRNLLLTPEQMQQMGMEKAVRHVDAINKWRAAQKAEANAKLAQSPAVHPVREYAENNPKGLRWVELKAPASLPEGFTPDQLPESFRKEYNYQISRPGFTPEMAMKEIEKDLRISHLSDQLKYEGDIMGHCVGRYCDDVASGRSRIFSLRDAKGEPHVTIETVKGGPLDDPKFDAGLDFDGMAYDEIRRRHPNMDEESDDFMHMVLERAGDMAMEWNKKQAVGSPDRIVQIKGKGNAAPVADYLPFVQDFVKSGNWSDVGDLHNTGLRRTSDAWNKMEQNRIRSHNIEIPPYMTQDEIDAIVKQVWAPNGYANGGLVRRLEENGVAGYLLD